MKIEDKDYGWDTLSGRLRFLMKELGMKQTEFARACGVSANYVSMLVTGRRESMSEPLYRLIAHDYNVNPEWLRTGTGDPYVNQEENDAVQLREELSERLDNLKASELRFLLDVLSGGK